MTTLGFIELVEVGKRNGWIKAKAKAFVPPVPAQKIVKPKEQPKSRIGRPSLSGLSSRALGHTEYMKQWRALRNPNYRRNRKWNFQASNNVEYQKLWRRANKAARKALLFLGENI